MSVPSGAPIKREAGPVVTGASLIMGSSDVRRLFPHELTDPIFEGETLRRMALGLRLNHPESLLSIGARQEDDYAALAKATSERVWQRSRRSVADIFEDIQALMAQPEGGTLEWIARNLLGHQTDIPQEVACLEKELEDALLAVEAELAVWDQTLGRLRPLLHHTRLLADTLGKMAELLEAKGCPPEELSPLINREASLRTLAQGVESQIAWVEAERLQNRQRAELGRNILIHLLSQWRQCVAMQDTRGSAQVAAQIAGLKWT